MEDDIDRIEFYDKLKFCKSLAEIEILIENIDNDELQEYIQNKYNQFKKFNKLDVIIIKDLVKILENAYLRYENL